ncbi:hypothetical protein [Ramlibacter humi]|uniref:Uncharacterized protein n=1 Tax=Ramlibacter humi TaxID=2530451 RepID=A0A4Z0CCZ3_9BURK|nr:hypothetical protein [Ramlibacter humi]TFZ08822.1 hypothetical protein EZ216_06680 [Ramlibacter humi]
MRKIWTPVLGWVAAVGAAVGLSLYAPHEAGVLGKVPTVSAKRLDQTQMVLPQQLPSGRTLALVVFNRSQREEVQSWIDGLGLQRDSSIVWVKLPVMNDPGDDKERRGIEQRLLERHPDQVDRARLVPLFTDREAFVRAAGLTNTDHASVLVIDRDGNVLARAEGPFDQKKGQALRETILAQNY